MTVKADVTRATGLVEAFTAGYPRIGWQLQGDAFRPCVEPDPRLARDQAGWDVIEDEVRRYAAFFDFGPIREMASHTGPVMPAAADGRLKFRHFKPSFVYRYLHMPGITLGQTVRLGLPVRTARHRGTGECPDLMELPEPSAADSVFQAGKAALLPGPAGRPLPGRSQFILISALRSSDPGS